MAHSVGWTYRGRKQGCTQCLNLALCLVSGLSHWKNTACRAQEGTDGAAQAWDDPQC